MVFDLELIVLPLLFGVISFFIPSRWVRTSALLFALMSLGAAGVKLAMFDPNVKEYFINNPGTKLLGVTFNMAIDGFGMLMLALSNLVIFLVALSNYNREESSIPAFNGLLFLMQFGLNGLFAAEDGILFYMFWEFTLIPVFLMLYWYGAKENQKNLLTFFLYTLFGSLFMLLSILAWSMYTPSFDYHSLMYAAVPTQYVCWIFSGFLLAFAVKIPLFPFHTWQPPTYSTAPMAGTMLLSAIMLKMALFGMIKWMIPLNYSALSYWQFPVIVLGLIGVVYGAVIALKEQNIRKVFAFASISHLGLIAAGIMVFSMDAILGSIIQIVNHSLIAIGLFLSADIAIRRFGTANLHEMGGLAKLAPKFGFWFGVMMLIALSVPMTAGFIGEFLLIKSIFDYHVWLGIVASLTLVLGAVYMIRAYQMSSMGAPKIALAQDIHWNEFAVFLIIALLAITFGLFPNAIISLVKPSIQHLLETVKDAPKILN
jgi:NADH-quinone oxidoreductase subunit M